MPLRVLIAACLVGATLGCGPQVRRPNFLHPGNAASQRFDAIYHDPYPLDDVGPAVEGSRPRGYQAPVPEVVRSRLYAPVQQQIAPPR